LTGDRWQQVVSLYEGALERQDDEREAYLADACPDDVELRREVSALLAQDRAVSPLDKPVWVADNLFVPAALLAAGTSIGPYRIEGTLGAGGMGQVYRARDTKLGRSVALKVLPDAYANDPDRRARFQREAQVLAALNHPHIAAIHGFEDSGQVHALVLELVEGRTLAERLAGGPFSLEDAMRIATQIVDAMEAAHDQGIVHRDLKPANIKIRPDGTVKVLDFGLARLIQPDGLGVGDPTASPTITSPAMMTAAGVILGTAAYMSPEQAKGRAADARSDVWAFGCVLFEMLTGSRPFGGEDTAETLAAVLRAEPNWSALPGGTPLALRRLLERCLQKDRKRRLAAIADVRWYFEDASAAEAITLDVVTPRFRNRSLWMLAAAAVAALAAAMVFTLRRPPATAHSSAAVQFTVNPPANTSFGGPLNGGTGNSQQVAMSPDGRTMAFLAGAEGRYQIWLRPIGSLNATPIPGTEDASFPFWSPDSQSLGFFADRKLKAVRTGGGPPVILSEVEGRGGSWGRDGVILLAVMPSGALQRVSSAGGTPVDVIAPDPSSLENYRWPHFLPDGQHFLFTAITGSCCPPAKPAVIRVGSLDRTRSRLRSFKPNRRRSIPPDT
jgi:serine/threonine protein kinase